MRTEPTEDRIATHGGPDVLEALPAAVVVLNEAGRVRIVNGEARELLPTVAPDALWREVIDNCFDIDPVRHSVRLRDGRHVRLDTCPLGTGGGQIIVLCDVTATIDLQRQVAQRERLSTLGRLSASLAHQIRTPLSAALLYGSRLEETDMDDETRRSCAARLTGRLRMLERLVRDMLLYVRGEVVGADPVDLRQVVRQLVAALKPEVRTGDVTLEVDLGDAPRAVLGNADALGSVLHNLASNAIESGATRLRLRVQGDEHHAEVVVVDDGSGIPGDSLERIFEPFFTTRAEGTGLGLPVARTVARAHQGDLLVDSEAGGGSRFTLRLPSLSRLGQSRTSRSLAGDVSKPGAGTASVAPRLEAVQ